MKINRVRYLTGPNQYSYNRSMFIELDIEELEYQSSDTLPSFNKNLLASMPGLKKHTCSKGYEGGFAERLERGTWMGHILEHMAIEMQNLAGINVKRGKTISGDKAGIYYVTYDYAEPKSGLYAFESSMEMAGKLLETGLPLDVSPYVKKMQELYDTYKLGPTTEAIYQAAWERKIPVERIGEESLLRLGTGSKQEYVRAAMTGRTSAIAVENACDKQLTKDLLSAAGIPVPEGKTASSMEEIFRYADELGYPLVLKPLNGRQGKGVSANLRSREELFNVVNCQDPDIKEFILERYYNGNDYRILVVDGKMAAASLRVPPYVIGTGVDTIRELIEKENKNPLRGNGHEKPMTKIPIGSSVSCYLEKSNLALQSVPEKGQVIQVMGTANLSTGGKAVDVTEQVHPSIEKMAVTAAGTIGLDIAGIDLICEDITVNPEEQEVAVIEVNAAPGIRMHHYPAEGKPRPAGMAIVDYLFPTREDAAIPVIAVTGTNGKTTTVRMLEYFLQKDGRTIGMANSEGIYIGGNQIEKGDCSGPISARKILENPLVDFAVLETARGGIIREGLAFRHCNCGIVTNVAEDHLGLDGIETMEDLVKLKSLIPEVVLESGHCILNANDPYAERMASLTKGNVIYISEKPGSRLIEKTVKKGGTAWYVDENGWIIYSSKRVHRRFLPADSIPVTIGGTALHNLANLLQALAAAKSQGAELKELKQRALSFLPDESFSRGRFNLRQAAGRKILIDYAHNAAGLEAVFSAVKQAGKKRRLISVFAGPGDRTNEGLQKMARVLAAHTDLLVIKEDADLRGRRPFETASILYEEAVENGLSQKQVSIIPHEADAFMKAWELSKPGDQLLFFYTDFHYVEEFFIRITQQPAGKKKQPARKLS